jgi:hypothetical protein
MWMRKEEKRGWDRCRRIGIRVRRGKKVEWVREWDDLNEDKKGEEGWGERDEELGFGWESERKRDGWEMRWEGLDEGEEREQRNGREREMKDWDLG